MRLNRRVIQIAVGLYLFCQIFFLINIQFPRTPNFDEFHYVPSAKQFLNLMPNQNWEHPPLGKMLMAVGIAIWGDRPIGWRFMSTIFGSLTLVGMYFLGWVIFENEKIALWIALITLFNQLVYVQARIGMLDTFMMGFLVWALTGFCATWSHHLKRKQRHNLLLGSGVLFGLSMACKWFAAVPWISCIILVAFVGLLQTWQMVFVGAKEEDWYRPGLWADVKWYHWVLYFGIVPMGVYFLTFFPFLFIPGAVHSPGDFFSMQTRMWEGQLRVISAHPYMSRWMDWPLLSRPIWYAFDREVTDSRWVRGVLLIGNPLIMWTGLLALIACIWDFFRTRNRKLFFIVFFYFAFFACWIVIPRKIAFYYYYYPAGLMLSFALAYVFHFRVLGRILDLRPARWVFLIAAGFIFVYFFPILAALKIPADSFRNWMWFSSWI